MTVGYLARGDRRKATVSASSEAGHAFLAAVLAAESDYWDMWEAASWTSWTREVSPSLV
jgi:hypothetical protein